jgi:nitroreductase
VSLLPLNPDELLSTTRAVRKRLDLTRDVPDELIRECVASALQAPSGSNMISMQFVVVKDAAKRKAIAEVYAACWDIYKSLPMFAGAIKRETDPEQAQQDRVADSATYLSEHMAEVPVLVLACHSGSRIDNMPAMVSASTMGNILPATWSFMLAARARGLGTAWTTIHLMMEQQMADVLGIPFDTVQQSCLTPLAYTVGTDFKAAMRPDPDSIIHWNGW